MPPPTLPGTRLIARAAHNANAPRVGVQRIACRKPPPCRIAANSLTGTKGPLSAGTLSDATCSCQQTLSNSKDEQAREPLIAHSAGFPIVTAISVLQVVCNSCVATPEKQQHGRQPNALIRVTSKNLAVGRNSTSTLFPLGARFCEFNSTCRELRNDKSFSHAWRILSRVGVSIQLFLFLFQ